MEITIPRNELLEAVNKVKTVVSAKSALPILSHILMEAQESSLKLSATDLKVSIECELDCRVKSPGSLTVSAQRLSSILAELPDGDVTITLGDKSVVSLDCGAIQTKLFSMAPDEFPPIRDFSGVEPIVMDQKTLKGLFERTSFAVSTDQARYNLTGLLFELKDGKLHAVATDGRRMSMAVESEGVPAGIDVKVIIPGKMISELERLLSGSDQVNVYIDETQAAFAFDSTRLVTALIEGSFPNYDMVIPKNHDKEAVMDLGPFADAMRRTRTMTNEKFNSVRLILSSGQAVLKVVTPEVGEYVEEMSVEYDGPELEIAFNPGFVLEALKHVDSDHVVLQLKDSMSPGVLKPFTDAPNDRYVNVIMPIRL